MPDTCDDCGLPETDTRRLHVRGDLGSAVLCDDCLDKRQGAA